MSADAQIRKDICKDMTNHGFFRWLNFIPIGYRKIRLGRDKPKYRHIFSLMYDNNHEYQNSYRLVKFDDNRQGWQEHVFVCALKSQASSRTPVLRFYVMATDRTVPFYVTKEYNVGLPGQPYKPGHFILVSENQPDGNHYRGEVRISTDIAFVEEPATIYTHQIFSIELYYLQIRQYVDLGLSLIHI